MTDFIEESVRAYVADYECLIDGVMMFLRFEQQVSEKKSMSALQEHYDAHSEDKLCHIYGPDDRRMLLCTRAGIEAIHRMAKRLVEEAPDGAELSPKAIVEVISDNVAQVMLDQVTDDGELVRRLKSYVMLTRSKHAPMTHHLPCVLMRPLPENAMPVVHSKTRSRLLL